jgi:uncharacterized protein YgbK (DUF1537 family)
MAPRVCFYGDDFTGSADALINYHRFGLRTALLLSPGAAPELARSLDVLGVAGVSRSLPVEQMEAEIRPVFEAFRAHRPAVVQYKVCSTFDSSPRIGSIGRACEIATEVFGPRPIPVLPAQPELGRWTAFGNHFARAGDGKVHRLDRHPGLRDHPSTPMREAQLSVHLAAQTSLPVAELHLPALDRYPELARAFRGPIVLDCVEQSELMRIGRLVWPPEEDRPLFAVGSGGLSYALGGVLGEHLGTRAELEPVDALLVVSGSCADQTAIQIGEAERRGWLCLNMHENGVAAAAAAARDALLGGRGAVVFSALGRPDRELTARSTGEALAEVVAAVVRQTPVRRVIACGGDTSSWLVRSLGVDALLPLGAVDLAPVVRTVAADSVLDGLEITLKGGQIGGADLFERLRAGARADQTV